MANNLSELTLRKEALKGRFDVLKTNKQDLDKELSKINKIGKTKEEIAEEEKIKKENIGEDKNKAETTDNKKEKETRTNDLAEDWSFMKGQELNKEAKPETKAEQKKQKTEEKIRSTEESDVLREYDLSDKEDEMDVNKIIDGYLTQKHPQNKKDKKWLDGFIKNIFSSLFDLKKANLSINKWSIVKETDRLFKKSQKKEPVFKSNK